MYDQENVRRGYVYILVNPVFTGFVKIGKTTKDPHARAREISQGTGVPAPYQVVWDALVNDYDNVERLIHEELAHYRTRNDREFFSLSPKQAIALVTRVVAPYVCEEESMAELTLASEMPMAGSLHPQDAPTGTIGSRAERTNHRENNKRMLATQNFTNIRRVDGFKHMDVTLGGDVIGFVRYQKATEAFWRTVSMSQWKGPVDTSTAFRKSVIS